MKSERLQRLARLELMQVNQAAREPCYRLCVDPGGNALPTYRLYRLDGAGKISTAEWIEAEADDHALSQARELVGNSSFELWERNRLVTQPAANIG
jgi:hypothetical protein